MVFLLATSACESEPKKLDLVRWEGEFVDYKSSRSLRACRGTHAYVDGFVPFVAAELGVAVPGRQHYLWLTEDDLAETPCDTSKYGCADVGRAFALEPWYLHELVHSVALGSGQKNQPFFTEGLAAALDPWDGDGMGPRYVGSTDPDRLPDPRPYLTVPTEYVHYPLAGSFVLFLLARHGSVKFMAMVRRLGLSRDMKVIRDVFQDVYQTGLDEEAELFMTGAPCTDQTYPVGLYDCAMPEIAWNDTHWSFHGVMDCEREDVAGGVGPDFVWSSLRSVTLEVPAAGSYLVSAQSEGDVAIQMGPCFTCPWDPRDFRILSGESRSVELDAGTYYMRVRARSDEAPELDVVITPE